MTQKSLPLFLSVSDRCAWGSVWTIPSINLDDPVWDFPVISARRVHRQV